MNVFFALRRSIGLVTAFLSLGLVAAGDDDSTNPILKLDNLHEENEMLVVQILTPVPIYRSPDARRIRAELLPSQKVEVFEMNRFGLHVRGRAKNGRVDGWAGWKQVLGKDAKRLADLEKLRERQLKVTPLLETKKPAIGMTLTELKRVFGPPSSIQTQVIEGKHNVKLEWIRKKMVDTKELLGPLAVVTGERELAIDAGKITVTIVDQVSKSLDINVPGSVSEVAVIPPLGDLPFEVVSKPDRMGAVNR